MAKTMWMIRAGRGAFLSQDFEDNSYVAIGWEKIRDLSDIKSWDELNAIYKEAYPDQKLGKYRMNVGQINRFRFEIQVGDAVITYNHEFRYYLVGEIVSEYTWEAGSPGDHNHIRKVNWIGKVNRDDLSTQTKNRVGSIATLFMVNEEPAREIRDLLEGKAVPKSLDSSSEEEESEVDILKQEIKEKSIEFIKDSLQKLDWDEMQELVAGILRAMGYKTRVASPGPDRGADIIASPDGLGFEQPRIRVEVKHRSGAVGAPLVRSFIGGLRQNDRGLYVSTGGFSREGRYEAERSTIPVTLVDTDELAELLTQYYDNTDSETRALVPLVKLYWPA